jgi:hypothetical protein
MCIVYCFEINILDSVVLENIGTLQSAQVMEVPAEVVELHDVHNQWHVRSREYLRLMTYPT